MTVTIERDVRPPGAYRLPGPGRDGTTRRGPGRSLVRLLHLDDEPIVVHVWGASGAVRLRAEAATRAAAAHGIERMRFALALDLDLREFRTRFKADLLLGPVVLRRADLRPRRDPEPFQTLAWAVCEQLIEVERAQAIERRLVYRWGRPSACGELRDAPTAAALGGRSQAELEACDLAGKRSLTLIRAGREVAAGRADLSVAGRADARLRRISGIGPWTLEKLAYHGQGDLDALPAGDLAYVKLVGRVEGLGRRASEDEVREFFAPYEPYRALAGLYALAGRRSLLADAPPPFARRPRRARGVTSRAPRPAAGRW